MDEWWRAYAIAIPFYLCDHASDIACVGGQEDGVGLFGQIGEGRDILLSHGEGGCCISILEEKYNISKQAQICILIQRYHHHNINTVP